MVYWSFHILYHSHRLCNFYGLNLNFWVKSPKDNYPKKVLYDRLLKRDDP